MALQLGSNVFTNAYIGKMLKSSCLKPKGIEPSYLYVASPCGPFISLFK